MRLTCLWLALVATAVLGVAAVLHYLWISVIAWDWIYRVVRPRLPSLALFPGEFDFLVELSTYGGLSLILAILCGWETRRLWRRLIGRCPSGPNQDPAASR